MRYNLESTLPINAFSPRAGRGPFSRGMTLEGGGGGGGVLGSIGNAVGSVVKGVSDVVKGVVQPVYNATLKQIPGVDNALVNLDKSVGKAIPGGWGTVASVATSFIPGSQLATMGLTRTGLATGLGALTGSGVLRKGNQFNLMGAIAGGAMAYGLSNLSQGLQEAGTATPGGVSSAVEEAAKGTSTSTTPVADSINKYGLPEVTDVYKPPVPTPSAPVPGQLVPPSTGEFASFKDLGPTPNIPLDKGYGLSSLAQAPSPLTPPAGVLDKIASGVGETVSGMGSSIADAGSGIKNLAGFGPQIGTQSAAYNALTSKFGAGSLGATIMGASTLASIEEQKNMLDQQLAQGNIAQDQYNEALASINQQRDYAQSVVNQYPITLPAIDVSGLGSSLYKGSSEPLYKGSSKTLYAMGGQVDDELGGDYSAMGMDQGNLQKGLFGMGYAEGGTPRFLSGGGDGMSDSIPATINNKQPARLADGEFVIPADVVSHLGNGSSKAGAKQLYSMMDRIRTARTGNKKQGKQVNPRKYMPA
jgi:hypothetical protein